MFFDSINAREFGSVLRDMRIIVLSCLVAGIAMAQSLTTDPPPIVQILRKPGTTTEVRQYGNARAEVNAIGLRSVTGLPETWMVEAHYSFASIEDLDRRLANSPPRDEASAPALAMIGLYRPGLSFRPAEAVRLMPKSRYFNVTIFRIRPGAESEFAELVRLRRAAADAINLDRPDLAFQVISGAAAGTYVFLAPLQDLRSMDDGRNPLPVYAEPIAAARRTDGKQISADIELSREHFIFRVEPRISWVADDFAEIDKSFWRR
jgi:hypothetical protein